MRTRKHKHSPHTASCILEVPIDPHLVASQIKAWTDIWIENGHEMEREGEDEQFWLTSATIHRLTGQPGLPMVQLRAIDGSEYRVTIQRVIPPLFKLT
jgi:hypothetical protein